YTTSYVSAIRPYATRTSDGIVSSGYRASTALSWSTRLASAPFAESIAWLDSARDVSIAVISASTSPSLVLQSSASGIGTSAKPIAPSSRSLNRVAQTSRPAAIRQGTGCTMSPKRFTPASSGAGVRSSQCSSGPAAGPKQHQLCPSSWSAMLSDLPVLIVDDP